MTTDAQPNEQALRQALEQATETLLPKLDQFMAGLTGGEKAVLVAIFSAPAGEDDTAGHWFRGPDPWRLLAEAAANQEQLEARRLALGQELNAWVMDPTRNTWNW